MLINISDKAMVDPEQVAAIVTNDSGTQLWLKNAMVLNAEDEYVKWLIEFDADGELTNTHDELEDELNELADDSIHVTALNRLVDVISDIGFCPKNEHHVCKVDDSIRDCKEHWREWAYRQEIKSEDYVLCGITGGECSSCVDGPCTSRREVRHA